MLSEVINEQVEFFKPLYDHLVWKVDIQDRVINSNKNALSRIIYNLLSNACKYNTRNGFITIETKEKQLTISNSSHGIKHPKRIFERFYKESERGLGIGLHIVDKLTKELEIKKQLNIKNNVVFFDLVLE